MCMVRRRSYPMACLSPWMSTTLLGSWSPQDFRIHPDGLLTYPLTTPPRTLSTSMGFWICWKHPQRAPQIPYVKNVHYSKNLISIARLHRSLKRPTLSSASAQSRWRRRDSSRWQANRTMITSLKTVTIKRALPCSMGTREIATSWQKPQIRLFDPLLPIKTSRRSQERHLIGLFLPHRRRASSFRRKSAMLLRSWLLSKPLFKWPL